MKARGVLVALVLGLLLAGSSVQAQTITRTLTWTQPGETLALVSTYTWSLKIDAAAAVPLTPTCQTAGANVTCASPLVLTTGAHTLSVTATNPGGLSATGTLNYVPPAAPASPSSVQITIQITVP